MVRAALVVSAFAIGAMGFLREPGCGGADSPENGLNAPCTRSKDCGKKLECIEGVCTTADAGLTKIHLDSGVDAADASGDAGDADGG